MNSTEVIISIAIVVLVVTVFRYILPILFTFLQIEKQLKIKPTDIKQSFKRPYELKNLFLLRQTTYCGVEVPERTKQHIRTLRKLIIPVVLIGIVLNLLMLLYG